MTYAVTTYAPPALPRSPRRGEPFRLIACHDTEGGAGAAAARGTIDWMAEQNIASARNASYHELWAWEPAADSFQVLRCVPPSHASHSIAPQPTSAGGPLYAPDAWVRDSLGSGWSDPNYWVYAIALAGKVAQVDAWRRDPRFLEHCRRRFGQLRAELGVGRRAEHFRFNPRTRSDWGRSLMAALGGLEIPEDTVTKDLFTDIADSKHRAAINRLAKAGIAATGGTGKYNPTALVTREELASFLVRALEAAGVEV